MSARVRPDPNHDEAVASVAAQGVQPPSIAVLGTAELRRLHALIEQPQRGAEECKTAAQRRRHEASVARASGWTNTVEAQRVRKAQQRAEKLEEEERRRCAIDAEEAELQQQMRERALSVANTQLHAEDHRLRELQSQLLLDAVLHERAAQVALHEQKCAAQRQAAAEEAQRVRDAAAAEAQERAAKAAAARNAVRCEKEEQRRQLDDLVAERRAQRQRGIEEGRELRRAAEVDEEERREQRASARRAACDVAEVQRAQQEEARRTGVSPRRTPRERHEALVAEAEADEGSCAAFVAKKAALAQAAKQRECHRREHATRRCELARLHLERLAEGDGSCDGGGGSSSSSRRSVEAAAAAMASGRSINDACADGEAQRAAEHRAQSEAHRAYLQQAIGAGGAGGARREAEAAQHRRRCEMIDAHVRELECEEREEAQQRRDAARQLAFVQQLQAREKRAATECEREVERRERRAGAEMQAEEDAMFAQFIAAQLPPSMPSPRRAKVMHQSVSPRRT